MRQLIQKFKDGDPISDSELKALIIHYENLVEELEHHGELFRLVWLDCYHSLGTLKGFQRSRNERK